MSVFLQCLKVNYLSPFVCHAMLMAYPIMFLLPAQQAKAAFNGNFAYFPCLLQQQQRMQQTLKIQVLRARGMNVRPSSRQTPELPRDANSDFCLN